MEGLNDSKIYGPIFTFIFEEKAWPKLVAVTKRLSFRNFWWAQAGSSSLIFFVNCFYLSNRPQESMVYRLMNDKPRRDVGGAREEFLNHEPQASDLRILLVFYQHPAWLICL